MKKAIFLDRDGTINIDNGYVYRREDFQYIPGVVDALRELQQMGYLLIIATNQSGIARGYFTEEQYLEFQKWIVDDLKEKGVLISKTYYCPHLPNGKIDKYSIECNCRKPKTELFRRAQKEFDISLKDSFVIGDKTRDLSLTKESDIKGILFGGQIDSKYKCCKNWVEVLDYIRLLNNE